MKKQGTEEDVYYRSMLNSKRTNIKQGNKKYKKPSNSLKEVFSYMQSLFYSWP